MSERRYAVIGYRDYRVPYEVVVEADCEEDVTDERVGVAVAEIPAPEVGELVDEQITSVVEV